ncbi:MAG: Unknown protein, partial [uncultured Thiotrichaceae bacterium]
TSETTRLSAPDPAEEIRRNRIMEAIRNGALG